MFNEDLLAELNYELNRFSETMYQVRIKTWEHIEEAYDSERLEGLLLSEIKDRLMSIVNSHVTKYTQNVHGLTPADLNTYSRAEVDTLTEKYLLPNSNLPYSFWGNPNGPVPTIGTVGSWSIDIPSVPCMIDGMFKQMPATKIPISSNNTWKVIYVWLKRVGSTFSYVTDITEYEEDLANGSINRDGQLYIGYVTTSGFGSRHFFLRPSIAIGGYRISTYKAGKSIPISDQLPMNTDRLNWV